jgi:hypothetical protein
VCKRNNINTDNAYTTYLKTADQKIYVDIDGSNNRFSSSGTIQTGVWYHVALVFDGSLAAGQRAALWINGTLDFTATESSATIPNYASSLMIGNTHPGAANWLNGAVDDVRFYRRALSGTEVLALAAPNYAPSVTAGPISPATNGFSSSVNGRVLDDGKGGTLTARWDKVSGPGNAHFANSNLVATTVSFDRSGDYVLRLAGSDTQAETGQQLAVHVNPNFNIFEDWIGQYYPGVTNSSTVATWADPDGDRAQNLLEFALGMNPSSADAQPFGLHQAGLPKGGIQSFSGTNYLSLKVQRPIGRTGITYAGEVSGDLAAWSPAVQAGPPVDNGDGTEMVIFRDMLPATLPGPRFIRLKISSL